MNKQTDDCILLTTKHGVATLTLNRPQTCNAFDDKMISSLLKYLMQIQEDKNVSTVVLRGNGKDFCAGGDIRWMQKMITYSKEENVQDALQLARLLQMLYQLNKPTIALVQGRVYGGGIGLVACCDIALGQADTTFCFSEVKLGLIPAVISPYIIKAIGMRPTRRFILTAEPFDAKEALKLGLLHEIVSNNSLEDRLETLLLTLRQNGPKALCYAKEMLNSPSIFEIEYTANLIALCRISEEAQEGLNAFLEKRKPHWQAQENN